MLIPIRVSVFCKAIQTSPVLFAELSKAERANLVDSNKSDQKQAKKEERQKKATLGGGQKGGAGRGGRETKTKKVKEKGGKNRGRGGQDDDDDDDEGYSEKKSAKNSSNVMLQFMDEDEVFIMQHNLFLIDLCYTFRFHFIYNSIFLPQLRQIFSAIGYFLFIF